MEEILVEVIKWVFGRTDPVIGCVLVIMGLYGWRKSRKLEEHIADGNASPHMMCCEPHRAEMLELDKAVAEARAQLKAEHIMLRNDIMLLIETQRVENRQDHQEIFKILRGRREG